MSDRRYRVARDVYGILRCLGRDVCVAHLAGRPLGLRRIGDKIAAPSAAFTNAGRYLTEIAGSSVLIAAQQLVDSLLAAIGSPDVARHAVLFRAFEDLAGHVELDALADLRPQSRAAARSSHERNILVIKLGALGDFIQALGPLPAVRHYHSRDRLTLLTTQPYVAIARQTGLFDNILVDQRPEGTDLRGWLRLRRLLRGEHFDRVYDLQTADRSNIYAWLMWRRRGPEWSGTAWRCSHPHANRERDTQHTMDRQAEQLLMTGIYPVSTVPSLPLAGTLPASLTESRFALLIPGSSPGRLAKRWPAERYGELARRLTGAGHRPVVVGVAGEEGIGRTICNICPETLDLVGTTDVPGLAALARGAALTIGNDTGATHVAAAGGNPVIVLFSRESSPRLCAPRGAAVQVLVEADLSDLSVEAVFAAAMRSAAPAGKPETATT